MIVIILKSHFHQPVQIGTRAPIGAWEVELGIMIDRQTDRQTDMRVPWEVSLPITTGGFWEIEHQFYNYASHWRHHSCICTYKYMCEYIIHSQLSWCISPPSLLPHRNDNHSLLIIQLTCFIINHQEKSLSLRFNKSKS